MATKLQHSIDFPCPPADFAAAVTSEQYWKDLVANVAADISELESFTATDDKVTVVLQQRVPEDKLPSIVTKVRPGDLRIARTVIWSIAGGTVSTGEFAAQVEGAPAKVHGTQTLAATATGSTVTFEGSADVAIPFVGGKVEKAIVENIIDLVTAEREYTIEWINAR
jgi:hypothetical protein